MWPNIYVLQQKKGGCVEHGRIMEMVPSNGEGPHVE
jgi:hypothetical protein